MRSGCRNSRVKGNYIVLVWGNVSAMVGEMYEHLEEGIVEDCGHCVAEENESGA